MPSARTYIIQCIAKAVISDLFLKLLHIISTINLFWTIRLELSKTIKALEKLKVSHMTNVLVIFLKGKKS
ncbi:hypothetical protein BC938DRAFT_474469 [Jimgerdemannia flammicorona]|uniref:Uncharacterized protein n=1 Tax=Jimgerdemannia flammicorona TaxID=994334 RepID=A0A433Q273_9FUNG|nr:hypothetical protein BC938DRAFT_474469 [Jimgerdemannia flammicorona]